MEIKLKNIGIVKESKIKLSGLTVITGKNNSGKTTVGKTLYSLIDGVSNLPAKAQLDREYYIREQMEHVYDVLRLLFRYKYGKYREKSAYDKYPALNTLLDREYRMIRNAEEFASTLKSELERFDVSLLDSEWIESVAFRLNTSNKEDCSVSEYFEKHVSKAIDLIDQMIVDIHRDDGLVNYTRESINQTLSLEFASQIQPINGCDGVSEITIVEDDSVSFNVVIDGNKVLNDGNPVFYGSHYKRAFLIDDPFIVDGAMPIYHHSRYYLFDTDTETILNSNRIVSHGMRLRRVLHETNQNSVLSQTILADSISKVKAKMDEILPGTFVFSAKGDFYVNEGKKLSVSNLATGSKMFSIIKILLEKGDLDNETILILDEPEAHLHPMWQNTFAEIIALLVKELDVNILLTTHSSNFMLAIDAFMRKYEIQEKTNFYQTQTVENGFVEYLCVNDDLGSIYADFLQYLSDVKSLRNKYL